MFRVLAQVFECLRKIALIGVPVLMDPGSTSQMVVGLIICFVTFGMYAAFAPYADPRDQLLSNICQTQTFFMLSISLVVAAHPNSVFIQNLLSTVVFIPVLIGFLLETTFWESAIAASKRLTRTRGGSEASWWTCVRKTAIRVQLRFDSCIGAPRLEQVEQIEPAPDLYTTMEGTTCTTTLASEIVDGHVDALKI